MKRLSLMHQIVVLIFLGVFFFSFSFSSWAESNTLPADAVYEEGYRLLLDTSNPQNLAKGISLILVAADAGSTKAMIQIGAMYTAGLGRLLSEDFEEGSEAELALSWYEKAAEAGDVEAAASAISSDAFSYFLGTEDGSIKEDDAVALLFFKKAAEYGDPYAINMMVAFYTYGFGVEQDSAKALELASQLADQGNADALFTMEENAYAYYTGLSEGIEKNFSTSFEYYLKLTEYGNERAMYNVGLLYEYGLGVSPDHEEAIKWLTKALDAGYEPAKIMLDELTKEN